MKKLARLVLTLAVAAILVAPAAAQNKKKKRKKGRKKARALNVVRLPRAVQETLSDEQKSKIAAINKEYAPKLAELFKKRNAILTPEQRKAQREAQRSARQAGKRGKALRDAVAEAVKLSDDQKKQQREIGKQLRALQQQARTKVLAVLTDEQKAKLRAKRGKKGKKGKKKRKKKNADN